MGKIWVEVCLISARGLRRTSSLFKLQWFAVGWMDPDNKYCTTIDASGSGNPLWKTKFSVAVDASDLNSKEIALHVEVHSREPIFLRSSLLGTATIVLKEFLDKYNAKSEVSKPVEEVGSFQLRKRNSNKAQGLVDISIRISSDREEPSSSYPARGEEFNLADCNGGIKLTSRYGSDEPQRHQQTLATTLLPESTHSKPIPNAEQEFNPAIHNGGIKLVNRYESGHTQRPNQTHSTSHSSRPNHSAEEKFYPTIHSEGIKLVNRYGTERAERPHQIHSTSQQHDLDDPMPTYPNNSHGGIKLVSRYGSGDSQRSRQTIPNNTMPIPPNYSQYHSTPGPSYSQKPHQTLNTSQYPEPNSPMPIAPNYSQNNPAGPSYQPSQTPPPPPSNVRYISNYFPNQDHYGHSYVNMPHSGAPPPGRGAGAGFGMRLGAGALAAGAMIFGDDFMSGFDINDPSGHTANPPF